MTKVVYHGLFLLGIPAMLAHQLGRRNLTEGQARYLRGTRMELEKQREGGDRGNQYTKKALPHFEGEAKSETAERLATQYKVSRATIERDAEYVRDVNKIAAVADTQGARIVMETEGKLGHKEVKALVELSQERPGKAKEVILEVAKVTKRKAAKAIVWEALGGYRGATSLEPPHGSLCAGNEGMDTSPVFGVMCGMPQVVGALEIEPEFRCSLESLAESQRHIWRNGATLIDDLRERLTRHPQR